MKGLLSEFTLADVLQVVSLSRQFTAIEVQRRGGRRHGVIWTKSGLVIAAQRGPVQGVRAFRELLRTMSEMFVVWRLDDPPAFSAPLGRIPELLADALEEEQEPRAEGSRALPLPPPPRAGTGAIPATAEPPSTRTTLPVTHGASPTRIDSDLGERFRDATPAPRLAVVANDTRPGETQPHGHSSGLVVAVCSPKGGVGKTTIALNLSVSLAQRGLRTVLIDADVNGDQLSLLNARDRVTLGVHDLLERPEALDEALRDTAAPNLRLLPAGGADLDLAQLERRDRSEEWRSVLDAVRARADIALVDCPAGMLGVTHDVLGASSHAIGVFQSEMVARRSFAMFLRGIEAVPAAHRPQLLGVVVNMFQRRSGPSLEAFHGICEDADRHRLFETTIPRSESFAEASHAGQPLRYADGGEGLSPVAWLFDMLADEVWSRFEPQPAARAAAAPAPFLL
jgi:chromosome partitioning protein